jgi:hypothetical protein
LIEWLLSLVFEGDCAVLILAAGKATLMHEVMMVPAEQYEVIKTRITTVRPVFDVVSIDKPSVSTAWKATTFVPSP